MRRHAICFALAACGLSLIVTACASTGAPGAPAPTPWAEREQCAAQPDLPWCKP